MPPALLGALFFRWDFPEDLGDIRVYKQHQTQTSCHSYFLASKRLTQHPHICIRTQGVGFLCRAVSPAQKAHSHPSVALQGRTFGKNDEGR